MKRKKKLKVEKLRSSNDDIDSNNANSDTPLTPKNINRTLSRKFSLGDFDDSSYFLTDESESPPPDRRKVLNRHIKYENRDSLFTTYHNTGGGYDQRHSLWGLTNLCFMILFVSLFRLVYQNFLKYGVLYESYLTFFFNLLSLNFSELPPLVVMLLLMGIPITISFILEMYFSRHKKMNEKVFFGLNLINLATFFVLMTRKLLSLQIFPFYTFVFVIVFLIVWFKLWSYYHVNYLCRIKYIKSDIYPKNISFMNMFYFIFIPTLVYNEKFPRTKNIKWKNIIIWLFEGIFALVLFSFMLTQYVVPLIDNAMYSIDDYNFIDVIDRIVRLTIPGIILYCLIFFVVFHCMFNIFAEILMFGDRSFYGNWWNSTSFDQFWRRWNLPVHRYCVYHIYLPMVRTFKVSRTFSSIVVFVISAFFHEYLLAVPFKNIKFVGFLSMIIELPVLILTRKYTKGKVIGNMLFWLCWMFGFSNIIMLYYFDYHYEQIQQ